MNVFGKYTRVSVYVQITYISVKKSFTWSVGENKTHKEEMNWIHHSDEVSV